MAVCKLPPRLEKTKKNGGAPAIDPVPAAEQPTDPEPNL